MKKKLNNINNIRYLTSTDRKPSGASPPDAEKHVYTFNISGSIHDAFKDFADLNHKSMSALLEEYIIEGVEKHRQDLPINVNLNVTVRPEPSTAAEMLEIGFLKRDLENWLNHLEGWLKMRDRPLIFGEVEERLKKAMPRATRLAQQQHKADLELDKLLERALSFFQTVGVLPKNDPAAKEC